MSLHFLKQPSTLCLILLGLSLAGCQNDSLPSTVCNDVDLSCEDGYICHQNNCHRLLDVGEACQPSPELCKSPASCQGNVCKLPETGCQNDDACPGEEICRKQRCHIPRQLGESCADERSFCINSTCNAQKICVNEAGSNEDCDALKPCVEGFYCKQLHCIEQVTEGENCEEDQACKDKLICLLDGVCGLQDLPIGDSCSNTRLCNSGLICQEGRCRKLANENDACDELNRCKQGAICYEGKCVRSVGECQKDPDCYKDSYCCTEEGCAIKNVCLPYGTGPRPDHNDKCAYRTVPGLFEADIQCEWPNMSLGPDQFPHHTNVLSTPLVMNTPHNSGTANELIFITYNNTDGGSASGNGTVVQYFGVIRIVNAETCTLHESIYDPANHIIGGSNLAMADVDGDGKPEIFAARGATHATENRQSYGIVSFGWDGTKYATRWATQEADLGSYEWGGPAVVNLDDDAVPEVTTRMGAVFNSITGERLNPGQRIGLPKFPAFADLDGNGSIDTLSTQDGHLYSWNGGTKSWSKGPLIAKGIAHIAYADFGTPVDEDQFDFSKLDGKAEVVSCGSNGATIYSLNGRKIFNAMKNAGYGGGPCTVGDFDGDKLPEIAAAYSDGYLIFDPLCQANMPNCHSPGIRWFQPSQDASSASTGSSLFDFDGDGKMEAVYADECYTRVYDGTTGDVLFSSYRHSGTWHEMPIIADIDNDGSAEIVVGANNNIGCPSTDPIHRGLRCELDKDCLSNKCVSGLCRCTVDDQCNWRRNAAGQIIDEYSCINPLSPADGTEKVCRAKNPGKGSRGIRVMRDRLDRWVSSRNLWNQHAYTVTNIKDDMTVPPSSQWVQNFTQAGLNNFRQNTQGTGGAHLAPDITGSFEGDSCQRIGSSVILQAKICNRGTKTVASRMPATFYVVNEDGKLGTKLCTSYTATNVAIGACLPVSCEIKQEIRGRIALISNDNGEGGRSTVECDDANNMDYTFVHSCPVN